MNEPIDIIIPWVDGSDPEWIKEKQAAAMKYCPDKAANSDIRYQDWDNLKYWFRAVEKFLPWVHRIFFVTWGHMPNFLNTENPKLEIVHHKDYIPHEYLPVFNSNTIEMNYYRIDVLSENFILFNDDMIPLQPIDEAYYFRNNKVCDEAVENIVVTAAFGPVSNMARYTQVNNMMVINKYFKKRDVQKEYPDIWFGTDYGELNERTNSLRYWNDFPGFHDPHMPSAFKKSTFKKLWELEPDILHITSSNHFRSYNDVTQYLARYWQICEGDIIPRKTLGKVYFVDRDNCTGIARDIREQRHQMICINENCEGLEFEAVKEEINRALEYILPDKSSFER